MDGVKSMRKFFHYMGIVAVLSALNTNISNIPMIDVVKNVSLTFMFNFVVGIPGGFSWMFGTDLYAYISKKLTK